MHRWIIGAGLALSLGAAQAAIKEAPVTYKDGDTTMQGFIVYDDANATKRPGVIVVPEWWGITAHVRKEARNLAGQGYTAFVADMYGDGKTADNPKDAGALSGAVRKNPAEMQSRFMAARQACPRARRSTRTRSPRSASVSAARWCSTWRARGSTSLAWPRFMPA